MMKETCLSVADGGQQHTIPRVFSMVIDKGDTRQQVLPCRNVDFRNLDVMFGSASISLRGNFLARLP